ADNRVVAILQFQDELVGLGGPSRFLDLGAGRVRFAISDVLQDRGAEEEGFLEDDTDAAAELSEIEFAHIGAINRHAAARRIVKADAVEDDLPAAWRQRPGAAFDGLGLVDDFEDALGAGPGVLHDVGELADQADTMANGHEIEDHFGQVTDGQVALDDLASA